MEEKTLVFWVNIQGSFFFFFFLINWPTAAGAGELWRRQQWAEPRAFGGMDSRRVHCKCRLLPAVLWLM